MSDDVVSLDERREKRQLEARREEFTRRIDELIAGVMTLIGEFAPAIGLATCVELWLAACGVANASDVSGEILSQFGLAESPAPANENAPAWPELTPRERDVAYGLAVGMTNRELADRLGIAIKTIDTHRAHVLRKLELRNNVELARLAIRRGYIAA